jgi:hypothetical protein
LEFTGRVHARLSKTVPQTAQPPSHALPNVLSRVRSYLAERRALGFDLKVLLIYPKAVGEKKPRTATCLSAMDEEQRQLFDLLNLSRYQRI